MKTTPLGVGATQAALVSDGLYPSVAVAAIAETHTRCLVSMFIADLTNPDHQSLADLVDALSDAVWRGVDTRVVLGGSRENYPIAATAVTARAILRHAGVPARWLTATPVIGSHAKLVIADDLTLLGSHNWSPGSFSGRQIQDSLLLDSAAFAGLMQLKFEQQWSRAGGPR